MKYHYSFPLILVSLAALLTIPVIAQRGGEIPGERVQLCITNQTGLPIHVYDVERGYKQGTVSGNRGCVKLRPYITDDGQPVTLCVQNLESIGCVPLPSVVWNHAPAWNLRLGPWTNTWHFDVWSLEPAAAAD